MTAVSRLRGLAGVAVALLAHERARTVLAVLGVALAVLATVLLASVGVGVVETGQQKFDQAGRDLWITGGPVELRPGTAGGFQNSLVGAHEVARTVEADPDVATAVPMAFQTVYASPNESEFQTIVAAGAPARGPSVSIDEGRPFQHRDRHYADGTYDGPMSMEIVLDDRAASLLGVGVGDTVHVGGTISAAREREFEVVGTSETFSQFVGAPTATLHLSELQTVTGTSASDRATFVTVDVEDGADLAPVEARLEATFPDYDVRTNREQLQATLEQQAVVVVSGASLVALAAVAGVLLVLNLQLSVVARHAQTFAAILALGTSRRSLATVVSLHSLCLGVLGGLLGVVLAVPAIEAVNVLAATVTGFENIAVHSPRLLLGGLGISVVVSALGGLVASLSLARVSPLERLR